MTAFLSSTIVGIVVGCIYALTATGLVVTYVTSGIFNFAHGAIGMIAAFAYWELTVQDHWPVPLAMVFVVLVLAPLLGVLIDVFVMRNLHQASQEVRVIVTVGVMLFLLGVGQWRWKNNQARILPQLFAGHQVNILGVIVTYHQLAMVATALAVAVGLRLFLFRTRQGTALRAVVDAPELASLYGAAPSRVRALGWVVTIQARTKLRFIDSGTEAILRVPAVGGGSRR